jgi:hypothetical protein
MADRLRQLRQFLIGLGTLKTLKICLRQRFGRWAADGIGLRIAIHSHSTINDIMGCPGPSSVHFIPLRNVGMGGRRPGLFMIVLRCDTGMTDPKMASSGHANRSHLQPLPKALSPRLQFGTL